MLLLRILFTYVNFVNVIGYYDSWLQDSPPLMFWCSLALSSSGQYVGAVSNGENSYNSAGSVYISSDYASTWSIVTSVPSNSWTFITLSSNGQYMVIVGGGGNVPEPSYTVGSQSYIYTSSNYGLNWTQTAVQSSWSGVASDSSGRRIVALSTSGIYVSSDYGQTWSVSSPSSNYQVASSATGQYLISSNFSVQTNNNIGGLFISSSYGATWSIWSPGVKQPWFGVTSSSSGQYMYAGQIYDGIIYVSSNYGQTFAQTSLTGQSWTGITTDSTGQLLAATDCCGRGLVYISSDYGQFYTTTAPASTWLTIASSSSFSMIVAAGAPG